jgi:hypothetical protein
MITIIDAVTVAETAHANTSRGSNMRQTPRCDVHASLFRKS